MPDANHILKGIKRAAYLRLSVLDPMPYPLYDDIMFSEGSDIEDEMTGEVETVTSSSRSVPARIHYGPLDIVSSWPSLSQAKFVGGVDAVLPNPDASGELYFFSSRKYALIQSAPGTTDDYIINGPKSILTAGFDVVDAVLPNPANSNEAYFFSGEQYVLIHFDPGTTDDYIINGPTDIRRNWPSLREANFKTVDAILPHPDDSENAYFFSKDQYALIKIAPGSTDDYIINGPKLVRTEWPSLHQAGFW